MKIIKQERIVRVIVPLEQALDTSTTYWQAAYKLMVLGSPQYQVEIDNVQCIAADINYIEDDFLNMMVADETPGVQVDWLLGQNMPYIELPKSTVVELPYFKKLENDTHQLILISDNVTEIGGNPPTFETLKQWQGLGYLISNPVTITEKMRNYIVDVE